MKLDRQEEYKRIDAMQDPAEQGYAAGPLILQALTDAHPEEARSDLIRMMLYSVQRRPFHGLQNTLRDTGLARWCQEQLEGVNDGSIEA